jgi:hypothetical protein
VRTWDLTKLSKFSADLDDFARALTTMAQHIQREVGGSGGCPVAAHIVAAVHQVDMACNQLDTDIEDYKAAHPEVKT